MRARADRCERLSPFGPPGASTPGGIKGGSYYGYEDYLYGKVVENFARHGVPVQQNNVHLVKGLFEDTLKIEGPVALAHIDGV